MKIEIMEYFKVWKIFWYKINIEFQLLLEDASLLIYMFATEKDYDSNKLLYNTKLFRYISFIIYNIQKVYNIQLGLNSYNLWGGIL